GFDVLPGLGGRGGIAGVRLVVGAGRHEAPVALLEDVEARQIPPRLLHGVGEVAADLRRDSLVLAAEYSQHRRRPRLQRIRVRPQPAVADDAGADAFVGDGEIQRVARAQLPADDADAFRPFHQTIDGRL